MDQFDQIFAEATRRIESPYMQLPIDGQEEPIYRERVYCYELYHRLRCQWPPEGRYSLAGEVDKSGHPLIRGNGLDRVKPDLLVHEPGDMGGNYAVIEVKPVVATDGGLLKDIRTLSAFRNHGQYHRAILLLYGQPASIDQVLTRITLLAKKNVPNAIDLTQIEFFWHVASGEAAKRVM
jgi:hypothetical protein